MRSVTQTGMQQQQYSNAAFDPNHSRSFRESAKQALAATKQVDGTLRIHTPFQEQQTQKVANLRQQLTKLSSTSNFKRCQSGLNDSSTNSVTAATSYAATAPNGGSGMTATGFHFRPNSNISNFLDGQGRNATVMSGCYGTEQLTRFSQNTYSKDLSPLRASNLNHPPERASDYIYQKRRENQHQHQESKKTVAQSAVQNVRRTGLQPGYSPVQQSNSVTRNYLLNEVNRHRRRESRDRKQSSTGSLYRSGSKNGRRSAQSQRTNQSSPERLVNIVCPPSKGSRNKHKSRISQTRTLTRPKSDTRHVIYNSFGLSSEHNKDGAHKNQPNHATNLSKKMKAFAEGQGFLYGSFNSNRNAMSSNQRHCLANLQKNRLVSTPLKSRKSATSIGQTRSKSKQKSRSCSRLSRRKLSNNGSALGHSANKSNHNMQHRAKFISKWVKSGSQMSRKRSRSNKSLRSKSARSTSRSQNSNVMIEMPSESMKREQRRVKKYLQNQDRDTNTLKKEFKFDSIKAEKQHDSSWPLSKTQTALPSGQVTGKFQSLNEQMINQMMSQQHQQQLIKKQQQVAFADASLRTEDDYCETLTASSEESPLRPAKRVQRAAQLTTKAYLDEVNQRVEKANEHTQRSVKEFGPRKLKAAYQGINERQGARLQCLKQQMKDSLIETHLLQSKLQSSSGNETSGKNTVKRGPHVSQFNSMVLEFSSNLELMASEMIEATEKKQRNKRLQDMLSEMSETRKVRSRSGSKSCTMSARGYKSPKSGSKKKFGKRSARKSTPKSARSKSSGKKLKKDGRKRSKSASKKLKKKRSNSKSVKRGRSASKSARSVASRQSGRSATSGGSGRGRSRSRKKITSVKRNIFKQTNGFRDMSGTSFGATKKRKISRSKSRRTSRSKSKSRSKSVRKRSLSTNAFSRARELAKKCEKLVSTKFNVINNRTQVPKSRKRSISRGKKMGQKSSRSKSKSKKRKRMLSKSKSRSKSVKKSTRKGSKSPINLARSTTPSGTQQVTPCMTPLTNILRNHMGESDLSDMRTRLNKFGSTQQNKKVKICSRRLQDISQLTSSDSDSSVDSEGSMSHERYMKRQQAHLSPWQRACIRKQLPKKFR